MKLQKARRGLASRCRVLGTEEKGEKMRGGQSYPAGLHKLSRQLGQGGIAALLPLTTLGAQVQARRQAGSTQLDGAGTPSSSGHPKSVGLALRTGATDE